jgi:tetratricopeptide (TPR) repeat protein
MASLAGTILDYVGYNTRKEVDKTEEILRGNAGMDIYKKKLQRADFLMKNDRYTMAFREYEFLLNNTPDIDRSLRAHIEHNEGVMYARLFLFEKAAERFKAAYEDSGNHESYLQYLSAIRMNLTNKEYVSFIADSDEAYEASMELESRMNEAEELYAASKDNLMLRTLALYKAESKMHEYYDGVGEITEEMKLTYRDLVKDKVK